MSVAGASLIVAVALVALAVATNLRLWVQPAADAWPREHLPALADWALVALALHALALIVAGTTSPGAYGLTVVLASAAGAVRRPPGAPGPEPGRAPSPAPERTEPAPVVPRRATLWSDG